MKHILLQTPLFTSGFFSVAAKCVVMLSARRCWGNTVNPLQHTDTLLSMQASKLHHFATEWGTDASLVLAPHAAAAGQQIWTTKYGSAAIP